MVNVSGELSLFSACGIIIARAGFLISIRMGFVMGKKFILYMIVASFVGLQASSEEVTPRRMARHEIEIAKAAEIKKQEDLEAFRSSPLAKAAFLAIEKGYDDTLIQGFVDRAIQSSPSPEITQMFRDDAVECCKSSLVASLKNTLNQNKNSYKAWMIIELSQAIEDLSNVRHDCDVFEKRVEAIKANFMLYSRFIRQGKNASSSLRDTIDTNANLYNIRAVRPQCHYSEQQN